MHMMQQYPMKSRRASCAGLPHSGRRHFGSVSLPSLLPLHTEHKHSEKRRFSSTHCFRSDTVKSVAAASLLPASACRAASASASACRAASASASCQAAALIFMTNKSVCPSEACLKKWTARKRGVALSRQRPQRAILTGRAAVDFSPCVKIG